MRTKTVLLSALLGALGSVSVHAQNVYSLNAVGYINVSLYPGFNIIACPLIASPDNTINTLLSPTNGQYKKWQVYTFTPTNSNPYTLDSASATAWTGGGTETINPGQAIWLFNPSNITATATFVGTVPTGPITNTLFPQSFNLISTAVPASGDIVTNSIMLFSNAVKKDQVYTYIPTNANPYVLYSATGANLTTNWPSGDPILPWVGAGFWYFNAQVTNNYWVENYSVNP
jgi:hypothetical protein